MCHFGLVSSVKTNGWIEIEVIQLQKIVFVIAAPLSTQEPTLSKLCISSPFIGLKANASLRIVVFVYRNSCSTLFHTFSLVFCIPLYEIKREKSSNVRFH